MEGLTFAKISKRVGLDEKKVDCPTMERVRFIERNLDPSRDDLMVEILNYHRFCKLDGNPEQIIIMNRVGDLLEKVRDIFFG